MLYLSFILFFGLILTSSGKPTASAKRGIRIPFAQRTGTINSRGQLDHNAVLAQTYSTKNKHRNNLINLKKNAGASAFPRGAWIIPLSTLNLTHPHDSQRGKRQGERLVDENDDTEWTGLITIGSAKAQFIIDFDTGSSDLWVPSSSCSSACLGKAMYDLRNSTTGRLLDGNFTTVYVDGSTVSGEIYQDNVTIASIISTAQTFSAVTDVSDFFADAPYDGILGMGFQSISNLNAKPFFQTAIEEGAVSNGTFAFKLSSEGSELYLGGTNSSLYIGDVEPHPVIGDGFWHIQDTGTTIMYGPPDDVASFYKAIPGSQLFDEVNGYYSYPCNNPSTIAIAWGGKEWVISSDNFNVGLIDEGSSDCMGALAGIDLGLGDGVWLLGDSFLKNVYSVFDVTNNQVGFATLA